MADLKFVADFTDIQTMRRELVGVAKDAKQSAGVFEREFRKVERQLTQSAKANQQFYNNVLQVDRVNKNAAKSAEVFTKELQRQEQATASYSKETERLKLQYNSTYRAAQLFKTQLRELGEAHSRGAISADRHEQQVRELKNEYRAFLKNGGGPMNQFGQIASKNTRIMKRFGAVGVQQLGYQIQDFAVQVQGGTSVLVALGQQGSQLLGIFGPAGAIAGMILAIGTGLAGAFLAARDAANDAANGADVFADALENAKSKTSQLVAEMKVLNSVFEDTTEFALGRALQEAQDALNTALENLADGVSPVEALRGGEAILKAEIEAANELVKLRAEEYENYVKARNERQLQKDLEASIESILGRQSSFVQEMIDRQIRFNKNLQLGKTDAKLIEGIVKSISGAMDGISSIDLNAPFDRAIGVASRLLTIVETIRGLKFAFEAGVDPVAAARNVDNYFARGGPMGMGPGPEVGGGSYTPGTSLVVQEQERLERARRAAEKSSGGGSSKTQEDYLAKLLEEVELKREMIGLSEREQERLRIISELKERGLSVDDERINQILQLQEETRKLTEQQKKREDMERKVQQTIESGLMSLIDGSASVQEAFTSMIRAILEEIARKAIVEPIAKGITSFFFPNANGNAFMNGKVTAFANGGVVNGPTVFPMANGMGLMGEAGPEAVMPLKRGKNGKLGVQVEGNQGNVTVQNHFHIAANGDESVKRIIAQEAPRIASLTQKQIMDQRRRGGAMKSTFG